MTHCSLIQLYPFCDPVSVSLICWRSQKKQSAEVPELFSATCWTALLSKPQLFHSFICSQLWLSLVVASLYPQVTMFIVFGAQRFDWSILCLTAQRLTIRRIYFWSRGQTLSLLCLFCFPVEYSLHYKNFRSHNCSSDSLPMILTNLLIGWEKTTWVYKLPESFQFYRVFVLQTNMCSGNPVMFFQYNWTSQTKLLLSMGSSVRATWSKCSVKVVGDDTAINNLWRLIDTPDRDT